LDFIQWRWWTEKRGKATPAVTYSGGAASWVMQNGCIASGPVGFGKVFMLHAHIYSPYHMIILCHTCSQIMVARGGNLEQILSNRGNEVGGTGVLTTYLLLYVE